MWVRELRGLWPTWYGHVNETGKTICIHIRYSVCSFGLGDTEKEAYDNLSFIAENPEWAGVAGPEHCIQALHENGYVVGSLGKFEFTKKE